MMKRLKLLTTSQDFDYSGINPKGFHPSQIKFYMILLPLVILMLLPIVFIFSHAFKPPDELFAYPPRFFVINPTFKNFTDLFSKMAGSGIPVSRYLFNSIVITVVTVGASIMVSTTAAYALSKKRFKLKTALFAINTVALMFVPIAVTIPRFLIIDRLHLMDTFWVHILAGPGHAGWPVPASSNSLTEFPMRSWKRHRSTALQM